MKLYVLVREDLSPSQRMVQAAHAVAELTLLQRHQGWDNGTIVILGVPDIEALHKWYNELIDEFPSWISFFEEPYYNNEMTAISVVCPDGSIRGLFSGLNLCKVE